jgi:DNA anti-recombination protein RmuC
MVKNKYLWFIFAGIVVFLFWSCETGSKKAEKSNSVETENVISEELHQAHCDLLAKANEELANINQKVRELNDKIREKSGGLTETQNLALDTFEAKQVSINQRMHEIKNIRQEEWENFKTTFEQDLNEIKTLIDDIVSEF